MPFGFEWINENNGFGTIEYYFYSLMDLNFASFLALNYYCIV